MSKAAHLFKSGAIALMILGLLFPSPAFSAETAKVKENATGLYRDIFDQNIYYDSTSYLRFDRLGRKITGKKKRSANVNAFDEIPDSNFFTNRHGRERLSTAELQKGSLNDTKMDLSGNLKVTKGKTEGLHPGFFIKDASGNEYLLKFDSPDYVGLNTSAEVVTSRFYHAIGYNVPAYTVEVFSPEKLVPGEGARIVDTSGFEKEFTKEKLEEFLLLIPWDADGSFRASASKILPGEYVGPFFFSGRRKDDPDDKFDHETMREIRALQVFASWLSNADTRASNTLDMLVTENGKSTIKHYVIDFNHSLGAATDGPKYPMWGHEYIMDNGETSKAVLGLGFWEKPWQRRWREAGEQFPSSAVGYFDNYYFDPGKYKVQLPHYAFKDLTRADGFWATKIIMAFTDEDIRSTVKEGQYSAEDADLLSKILIERRDIIGKYWFNRSNPLDRFDVKGQSLTFEDLAKKYKLETGDATYRAEIFSGKSKKAVKTLESREESFDLEQGGLSGNEPVRLVIRTTRGTGKESPYVAVGISGGKITRIQHED